METSRHVFRVERREIAYLKMTLEAYDGMALLRTLDPKEALIELHVSPGCEKQLFEVLQDLIENESLKIEPVSTSER